MPEIRGREGEKEREGERERERERVRWKCLFSHFKVPGSVCVCVCVFKINRACDEQPVPRWKYILWNTTVLCRNLAKHWLGSIELQLLRRCEAARETHSHSPISKDVTFMCASQPRRTDTNRASLSRRGGRSGSGNLLNQLCSVLNRTSTSGLVTTVCCVCSSCTAQSTATT